MMKWGESLPTRQSRSDTLSLTLASGWLSREKSWGIIPGEGRERGRRGSEGGTEGSTGGGMDGGTEGREEQRKGGTEERRKEGGASKREFEGETSNKRQVTNKAREEQREGE